MTLHGVDVSSFQGPPGSWIEAAGSIQYAAVKITELSTGGLYTNPVAAPDWDWLKTNGKNRIAYLFAHPAASALATVEVFLAELATLGFDDGDAVAVDLETSDGHPAAAVATWVRGVLEDLTAKTGRTPLLYTFLSFAEGGYTAGCGSYPLWIADPNSPAGRPRIPAPWAKWALHQYSMTGIDRDVADYPTAAEMRRDLGRKSTWKPPAKEDPSMFLPLPPGAPVVFAPWAAAKSQGLPGAFSNVSLVLSGDTGAVVSVIFRGVASGTETHTVTLAGGKPVPVVPKGGWAGVGDVRVLRTDTSAPLAASAVVTRW